MCKAGYFLCERQFLCKAAQTHSRQSYRFLASFFEYRFRFSSPRSSIPLLIRPHSEHRNFGTESLSSPSLVMMERR